MGLSKNLNSTLFLLVSGAVLLAVVAPSAEATIDFNWVMLTFESCSPYVEGGKQDVLPDCCRKLKSLVSLVDGSADWQAMCYFMQPITHYAEGQYASVLASLPEICGVDFHFKIGSNVDCSKVN